MIFSVPLDACAYIMERWDEKSHGDHMTRTFSDLDFPAGSEPRVAITETGSSGSGMVVTTREMAFDIASSDDRGWQQAHTRALVRLTGFLSDELHDFGSRIADVQVGQVSTAVAGAVAITTLRASVTINEDILE